MGNCTADAMKTMVQARNQDANTVLKQYKSFFARRRNGVVAVKEKILSAKTTPVTYDGVTGQHTRVAGLIRSCFKGRIRVVYQSRNKVASILCPKRKTISKLSRILNN